MKKKYSTAKSSNTKSPKVNEAALDYPQYSIHAMEVTKYPLDNNMRSMHFMGLSNYKKSITNKVDYIHLIRMGVPKKSLDKLMEITDFTALEMAAIVHTTDRTLRRYTDDQKLNPEQSERVIELAGLYARGEEIFEDLNNFKVWMNTPIIAFGNIKPKEFLDTSIGIEMILDELGRIQHGVFA